MSDKKPDGQATRRTGHTPGPWKLQGKGTVLHPASHAQLTTTRIETSLGTFEVLDETNEPEANALLIAAAPDMLAFVRYYLDSESTTAKCDAMAKAALSKSKGGK